MSAHQLLTRGLSAAVKRQQEASEEPQRGLNINAGLGLLVMIVMSVYFVSMVVRIANHFER